MAAFWVRGSRCGKFATMDFRVFFRLVAVERAGSLAGAWRRKASFPAGNGWGVGMVVGIVLVAADSIAKPQPAANLYVPVTFARSAPGLRYCSPYVTAS
jgi:hypothetical protein